jgi:hypothetical protein
MVKTTWFLILFLALIVGFLSADDDSEKAAIKKVIEDAYMNGVVNIGDVDAVKQGFHEDFSLKGIEKGKLFVLPIADWIEGIKKRKAAGEYPAKVKTHFEYPLIDITGTAAMVKVKFKQGEKLVYTDYLLLLKFEDGWRLTDKVYYRH